MFELFELLTASLFAAPPAPGFPAAAETETY